MVFHAVVVEFWIFKKATGEERSALKEFFLSWSEFSWAKIRFGFHTVIIQLDWMAETAEIYAVYFRSVTLCLSDMIVT